MKKLEVDITTGYKIIKENIYNCQTINIDVNSRYHHNCDYKDTTDLINNGILSYSDKQLLKGIILTDKEKKRLNDDYHVNGSNLVSLSSLDINYDDLYRDELIYDPYSSSQVDILVSGDVKAYRNSTNYANEFLSASKLNPSYFESIDVRLLKNLNDKTVLYIDNSYEYRLTKIIEYYNYLRDISLALINNNLNIPLREMSEENVTLDINKVKDLPKIYLKQKHFFN